MSCGPARRTFRLLDGYVGWEALAFQNLEGQGEGEELQLARITAGAIGCQEPLPWLPPGRLARGCGACDWVLAAAAPESRLLRRSCTGDWEPVPGPLGERGVLAGDALVAARRSRIAVADPACGRVWLLAAGGAQVLAVLAAGDVTAIALTAWRECVMAVAGEPRLRRCDREGGPLVSFGPALPPGRVIRIGSGRDCALWILVERDGACLLYRAGRDSRSWRPETLAVLAADLPRTTLAIAADAGFCFEERGDSGLPERRCYDWAARPMATPLPPPAPPPRQQQGQLLAGPIDSGLPRCRWHRVRIDADVPARTQCWVEVAASEDPHPPDQGVASGDWAAFAPGPLHPDDWQTTHPGDPLDFLVRQPPGRYLFLRLRLTGDGVATPAVRRIRLDVPRSTSLERLPAIYRETPDAEDFTERFLSLFDATVEQIDRAIERAPALLDGDGVPDEVLPWLGAFLDIAFDPAWTPAQRRALLKAAPRLYEQRGTRAGLIETIRILTGVSPAVVEAAANRRWGVLDRTARVGGVRLFGRSNARFRLGTSGLGNAPLRSFGSPEQDPLSVEAFRFQVLVPPQALGSDPRARQRLSELVASIKPAHTVASLRVGGGGFVLGVSAAVGVDTVLGGLPAAVLGSARLSRQSVVAPGRSGRRVGFTVGEAAVGSGTRIA